jgi:PKD repeat protein
VKSTEEAPSFTFAAPGLYTVDLLMEDADGRASRLTSKTIRIGDSNEPNFISSEETPKFVGRWDRTRGPEAEYRKKVAFIDRNEGKGEKSATYTVKATRDGKYLIALAYSSSTNRATNVPVTVRYGDTVLSLTLNQKKRKPALFAFQPLTEVDLKAGQEVSVEISNKDTDGFVVADQFRLIWKDKL